MPSISCSRASKSESRHRLPAGRVAIAVDGLADQRDFQAAVVGQPANFLDDLVSRPALFRSAHAGHDAIRAELVAAEHDPHQGLMRHWPHGRRAMRIVILKAFAHIRSVASLAIETYFEHLVRLRFSIFPAEPGVGAVGPARRPNRRAAPV